MVRDLEAGLDKDSEQAIEDDASAPARHYVSKSAPTLDPYQRLYLEIIALTLCDAFARVRGVHKDKAAELREDALAWLTSDNPYYKRNRELVCALAGVSAEKLKSRTLAIAAGRERFVPAMKTWAA